MCSPQSRQDLTTVGSLYFPEKGDPRKQGVLFFFGKFVAKLLKTIKKKMKKQTKSASRVVGNFDSREPRAIGLAKDVMIFLLENHVTNLAHVR